MSSSNKKLLISGCGFSWSGQKRITWPKLLYVTGNKLTDVGGPAVSNQWVVNQVVEELHINPNYDIVILQLTSTGKLDVDINRDEQLSELVEKDSIRNFVYNNVWPSSHSKDHESKKLYYQWLASPRLEIQDLWCKLIMLKDYCSRLGCELFVTQGYNINWSAEQKQSLSTIVDNIDNSLYDQYKNSNFYQTHDYENQNMVPCLHYQLELAIQLANKFQLHGIQKLKHLESKL